MTEATLTLRDIVGIAGGICAMLVAVLAAASAWGRYQQKTETASSTLTDNKAANDNNISAAKELLNQKMSMLEGRIAIVEKEQSQLRGEVETKITSHRDELHQIHVKISTLDTKMGTREQVMEEMKQDIKSILEKIHLAEVNNARRMSSRQGNNSRK